MSIMSPNQDLYRSKDGQKVTLVPLYIKDNKSINIKYVQHMYTNDEVDDQLFLVFRMRF